MAFCYYVSTNSRSFGCPLRDKSAPPRPCPDFPTRVLRVCYSGKNLWFESGGFLTVYDNYFKYAQLLDERARIKAILVRSGWVRIKK